jgi:hypothetical protein
MLKLNSIKNETSLNCFHFSDSSICASAVRSRSSDVRRKAVRRTRVATRNLQTRQEVTDFLSISAHRGKSRGGGVSCSLLFGQNCNGGTLFHVLLHFYEYFFENLPRVERWAWGSYTVYTPYVHLYISVNSSLIGSF